MRVIMARQTHVGKEFNDMHDALSRAMMKSLVPANRWPSISTAGFRGGHSGRQVMLDSCCIMAYMPSPPGRCLRSTITHYH